MSRLFSKLAATAIVLSVMTVTLTTAQAENPALRLWKKQHPGSTPPSSMLRGDAVVNQPQTEVNRSFSYAPGSSQSSQTVRSYSYNSGSTQQGTAQPSTSVQQAPIQYNTYYCQPRRGFFQRLFSF